ncbi:hypothetical protein KA107_03845 [Candidatus Pacearchaeota archaeon]|nr:hypothetical protein [Candidatus Pacearchaeota archaeon]
MILEDIIPSNKPIIKKVMLGYEAGRFKALMDKLPLGLFQKVEEEGELLEELAGVERDILAGGYSQENLVVDIGTGFSKYAVFPKNVRKKAMKCYRYTPGSTDGVYSRRIMREGLRAVLENPRVCRKATKTARAYLDSVYEFLVKYAEERR